MKKNLPVSLWSGISSCSELSSSPGFNIDSCEVSDEAVSLIFLFLILNQNVFFKIYIIKKSSPIFLTVRSGGNRKIPFSARIGRKRLRTIIRSRGTFYKSECRRWNSTPFWRWRRHILLSWNSKYVM